MIGKAIKQSLNIFFLIILLVLPYFVFADNTANNNTLNNLKAVGETGGAYAPVNETSAAGIAGTAVKTFLSILGVIFLILMLYGGYNWMIAHGEEQKVEKAKDTIRTAIIGLVIIVGSYAIWNFILVRLIGG